MTEFDKEENSKLRSISGIFVSNDKLTSFFYTLMRDHLTPGIVQDLVNDSISHGTDDIHFSNGWLAEYSEYLANKYK